MQLPSVGQAATVRETTTLPPGIWVCVSHVKLTRGASPSKPDSANVCPSWHDDVEVHGLVLVSRGVANTGPEKELSSGRS